MKFAYHEVEITRRCNTKCDHCLRGKMQPVDIKAEYLREFFSRTTNIDHLILTGGEPTMAVQKIRDVASFISIMNVQVKYVGMIINGLVITDSFLQACQLLESQVGRFDIRISSDVFRKPAPRKNVEKLFNSGLNVGFKSNQNLVSTGKAFRKVWANLPLQVFKPYWILNGWVMEPTYLNALGNLVAVDGSYLDQEEWTLGSVYNMGYNMFMEYDSPRDDRCYGGIHRNWSQERIQGFYQEGPSGPTQLHEEVDPRYLDFIEDKDNVQTNDITAEGNSKTF